MRACENSGTSTVDQLLLHRCNAASKVMPITAPLEQLSGCHARRSGYHWGNSDMETERARRAALAAGNESVRSGERSPVTLQFYLCRLLGRITQPWSLDYSSLLTLSSGYHDLKAVVSVLSISEVSHWINAHTSSETTTPHSLSESS